MFFNPLFIDTNSAGALQNQKGAKLGKAQYMFSDIIKISLSQNASADTESTPLFNLSLIDNLGSISSLFSSVNSNAVKSAIKGSDEAQDGSTILANFLQFAFVNQNPADPKQVDISDIMKDKELMLSKESLTKSLSQLLQLYKQQTDSGSAQGENAPAVNPENLAAQILQSIDEKGKAVLNFNNNNSQIKIELTKLDSKEKELFISTKIIPMMMSADAIKKSSIPAGSPADSSETAADALKKTNPLDSIQIDGNIKINSLSNGNSTDKNTSTENKNSSETGTVPVPNPTAAAESKANPVNPETSADIKIAAPANAESAQIQQAASQASAPTAAPQPQQVSAAEQPQVKTVDASGGKAKTDNDYKLRVVEVNSEKAAVSKEENITVLNSVEKNLLKKAVITANIGDTSSKKASDTGSVKSTEAQAAAYQETVNTVDQAEQKILKSNNMLFDQEGKASSAAEKADVKVSEKTGVVKEEQKVETLKGVPDLKADTKTHSAETVKSAKTENIKDTAASKKVKGFETADDADKTVKADTQKSVKQTVVADDTKTKIAEPKKDMNDSVISDDKKPAAEAEKASLKPEMESAQKDMSNTGQNSSEKKSTDNKQGLVQGINDKEKFVIKDESVKDAARQPEVSKTIKTYEIIKEIKSFIEAGNRSTMTLKIMPENLGEVKISVDMVKNMLQARIDVDSENVKQFVQTNLDHLKQSLNQSGVNLSTLQVNISSSDQKNQRYVSPHRKKGGSFAKETVSDESEDPSAKKILGYNSYDYLA